MLKYLCNVLLNIIFTCCLIYFIEFYREHSSSRFLIDKVMDLVDFSITILQRIAAKRNF